MTAATTVAAASGRAASMRTTRDSVPTGVPLTRSNVNGRLRSTRPPPTATARLQPATTSVSATAKYTIFSAVAARAVRIVTVSPNVRGGVGDTPGPQATLGGVC